MIRLQLLILLLPALSWSFIIADGVGDEGDVRAGNVSAIRYQLYTRLNSDNWQTIELGNVESLKQSNFSPVRNTKIYAVGWSNDGSIANSTKKEYLVAEDCNFIIVDWEVVQSGSTSSIMIPTGYHLAQFIDFLVEVGNASIQSVHLVGHSAGVVVSAAAASAIKSGKLPRITGLDPLTETNDPAGILDPSDADFVDIMHTSGGEDLQLKTYGHVEFYVNGANQQPGCGIGDAITCCSHCRAADLFAESITTPVGFKSVRCDSYANFTSGVCNGNDVEVMGENVSLSARGIFYVNTNIVPPYALG